MPDSCHYEGIPFLIGTIEESIFFQVKSHEIIRHDPLSVRDETQDDKNGLSHKKRATEYPIVKNLIGSIFSNSRFA